MAKIRFNESEFAEVKKILNDYRIDALGINDGLVTCRINGSGLPNDENYWVRCWFSRHGNGCGYSYAFYPLEAHRVCDDLKQGASWKN